MKISQDSPFKRLWHCTVDDIGTTTMRPLEVEPEDGLLTKIVTLLAAEDKVEENLQA